jgi:hypothetical protein
MKGGRTWKRSIRTVGIPRDTLTGQPWNEISGVIVRSCSLGDPIVARLVNEPESIESVAPMHLLTMLQLRVMAQQRRPACRSEPYTVRSVPSFLQAAIQYRGNLQQIGRLVSKIRHVHNFVYRRFIQNRNTNIYA